MSKHIATLDSESMGFDPRSVVWEIGIILATVDAYYTPLSTPVEYVYKLRILDQIRIGRTIETQALDFHMKKMGTDWEEAITSVGASSPGSVVREIMHLLQGREEVWINKASYDSSLLHSLARDYGCQEPLWDHKAELDLRTLYRVLEIPKPRPKAVHRAIEDCRDNMVTLQAGGEIIRQMKMGGLMRTPETK